METNPDQPKNDYENVLRNLKTYAAIGLSILGLSGAELAATTEPVSADAHLSSELGFEPGLYTGYTSQVCSTGEAAQGVCTAGERMPISFVATRNKVKKLSVVVIDSCTDLQNNATAPFAVEHNIVSNSTSPLFIHKKFFGAPVPTEIGSAIVANDNVAGKLNKNKASGMLTSLINVNSSGQYDPNSSVLCGAGAAKGGGPDVRWHATHK